MAEWIDIIVFPGPDLTQVARVARSALMFWDYVIQFQPRANTNLKAHLPTGCSDGCLLKVDS